MRDLDTAAVENDPAYPAPTYMRVFQTPLLVLIWLAVLSPARAFFVTATPVPIDRLVANAEKNLKAGPSTAEAHFKLARIQYLAFANGITMVTPGLGLEGNFSLSEASFRASAWSPDRARHARARELALRELDILDGRVPRDLNEALRAAAKRHEDNLEQQGWTAATSLSTREMIKRAAAVERELTIAQKLEPEKAFYALCHASFAEQFVGWVNERKQLRLPAELKRVTLDVAEKDYLAAFRLAYASEGKLTMLPEEDRWRLISYEAGRGFLRLAERTGGAAGSATRPETSRPEVAEVTLALQRIEALKFEGMVLVTPLLLALTAAENLDALLQPGCTVDFDLAGCGPRRRWPWVKPTAGFLVWDPLKSGDIRSGRQLFGGYTFQLFWGNGYEAISALDDDGDGELRGEELEGIRIWFDENGDGRSSPDEVHDLAEIGVVALAVHVTGQDGRSPMSERGVRFADGRVLPTWDWIAEAVQP